MYVIAWKRNDGSGLLDSEFRDGDIMEIRNDETNTGTEQDPVMVDTATQFGTNDKSDFLIVHIPNPPNYENIKGPLVKPEYAQGATADEPEIRRARKHKLNYRSKFTTANQTILDAGQALPNGPINGGVVTDGGIVRGLFTYADISRK